MSDGEIRRPLGAVTGSRRQLLSVATLSALAVLTGAAESDAGPRRPGRDDRSGARSKDKEKKKRDRKGKKKKKGQQASGSGKDVVRFAQKYKGSRYKLGGESPKGFDCSGFTWYVYNKAAGMEIGRVVKDQWKRGKSVSRGDLKDGDLVFFKNTAEKGLSHVGISLGGSKFIHAENENTGVVISSVDSDYYSKHYAGARRLL
jgi:cell wall-associated NlpC family hydrolase